MSSLTMSLKETSSVVAPSPLFSKFKSRAKDAESPKSVISDPRIVSPTSSASASLERRLTDLKKVTRHDRVHSISDAEEENALPGVNLSAVLLSRQLSTKASNGHLLLESVSEVHSLPSVPPRMGQISGPSSETSSPRNRMSRNAGKDGTRGHLRGSDSEFLNRRMSSAGADTTTSSILAPLPHSTDHEGEYTESKSSNHGDGRSTVSGTPRQSKIPKTTLSPGESPGHPTGYNESPRSTLIELSSDFVMKATSQGVRDFPGMQIVQKDTRTYTVKSTSESAYSEKNLSTKSVDGWKKSLDSHVGNAVPTCLFPPDGPPSLHSLPPLQSYAGPVGTAVPESHNGTEKGFQHGGKVPGAVEASKTSLMPQQRFVPGQFLKSNPLKPRPPPAKWDDAEKWLVNPASIKSNAHSQHGNGHLSSGGSTPQHISQLHAAASVRQHHLPSSTQSSRSLFGTSAESISANAESYDTRLLSENGDVSGSTYPPTNAVHYQRSYDSSATIDHHEDSLPVDAKVSQMSNRDETGTRPEDKFANSVTVQTTSPNNGRLIIVMKDAATEITPSTSQRDIATQVTPAQSFHAPATPPRIHNNAGPARLNTTPVHSERRPASVGVDVTELQNCHQAKLELDQAATLDTNWTTREEEVEESAKSLRLSVSRSVDFKEVKRNVLEARAAAWEEAEQSKYMARYHREEAKILAWEAHQKAKAEAGMRKMEVKLERMRSHANELLQNKLATVHLKAENMRAAAASECGEQAAKTNHWAQEIRFNGRSPSPGPLLCCFPRFNSCSPSG